MGRRGAMVALRRDSGHDRASGGRSSAYEDMIVSIEQECPDDRASRRSPVSRVL